MMYSNFRFKGTFQQWVDRGIDRGGKQMSPRCPRGAAATRFSGLIRGLWSAREGEVGNVLVEVGGDYLDDQTVIFPLRQP